MKWNPSDPYDDLPLIPTAIELETKAVLKSCILARAAMAELKQAADYVRNQLPKIYSRELIDVIFEQPYCRISDLVNADIAKRQTASEYLKKLADLKVLEQHQFGREQLFLHPKLLALVTKESNEIPAY